MPEVITKPEVKIPLSKQEKWIQSIDLKWSKPDGSLVAPKDYVQNLLFRTWLSHLKNNEIDPDHMIKRKVLLQCKNDIHFFFNAYLWTADPRKRPADLPFITYDFQDKYINWLVKHIKEGKDCLTEKSRDMGVSWCVVGVLLHYWMFSPGFLGHLGSKKEEDVDRSGDVRSLFEKLRYLIRNMPPWFRPFQFNFNKHSKERRIINPSNDAVLTGESANENFSRAGRYTCVFLDEFAAMDYAESAWTASGDTAPCRIVVSTPQGTGNQFWKLRFKSNIDRFTAHWTLHPEKAQGAYDKKTKVSLDRQAAFNKWSKGEAVSSPWYEAECERRRIRDSKSHIAISQELDIDYLISGDPYFDVEKVKKQREFELTEDWLRFSTSNNKVIIGILTEINGKIEFRPNKNGWLRLFEMPRPQGQYVGALDPAGSAVSGDFCAGAWREKRTRNLVAGIFGHYNYEELSYYAFMTSKFFNGCMVCSESGGYGAAVNKALYDLGANVANGVNLTDTGLKETGTQLGFITNSRTRPLMLSDLAVELEEDACELRDKDLKTECLNFVNNDGKPQAATGSTDDYIFAFAIAGQLIRLNPYSVDHERRKNKSFLFRKPPPANQGMRFRKV